jgi:hypothetical protein
VNHEIDTDFIPNAPHNDADSGLVYPIAITGVARIAFPEKSEGSLVVLNGRVVGSELIGQKFSSPRVIFTKAVGERL